MPDAPPPGSEKADKNIEFTVKKALEKLKIDLNNALTRLEEEWRKNIGPTFENSETYRKASEKIKSDYAAGFKAIDDARNAYYAMRHTAKKAFDSAHGAVEQDTKSFQKKMRSQNNDGLFERLDQL